MKIWVDISVFELYLCQEVFEVWDQQSDFQVGFTSGSICLWHTVMRPTPSQGIQTFVLEDGSQIATIVPQQTYLQNTIKVTYNT